MVVCVILFSRKKTVIAYHLGVLVCYCRSANKVLNYYQKFEVAFCNFSYLFLYFQLKTCCFIKNSSAEGIFQGALNFDYLSSNMFMANFSDIKNVKDEFICIIFSLTVLVDNLAIYQSCLPQILKSYSMLIWLVLSYRQYLQQRYYVIVNRTQAEENERITI